MKIVVAHSFYRTPGGEDSYVREQVDLLSKSHDVLLLRTDNRDLDGRLHAVARASFSLGMRRTAADRINAFRPDVIHIHNIYPSLGPAVHQTARALKIPLVMTVHNFRLRCPNGVMFTEGQICNRCISGHYHNAVLHDCFSTKGQAAGYAATLWIHRFITKLEDSVNVFVAPSHFMRNTLMSWGFEASRVRVVRHAVREIATGTPPVSGGPGGYLGRLAAEKGLGDLLRALKSAGDPPFRIAGNGPQREELESTSRELGLRNVEFLGYLAPHETRAFLLSTRFLVFPSNWEENSPLAAHEAISIGRPIIVSDRGGLPELADGRGIVYKSGDIDALAESIDTLTSNNSLCESYGTKAWKFALQEFDPAAHERNLLSIYNELVAEERSGQLPG